MRIPLIIFAGALSACFGFMALIRAEKAPVAGLGRVLGASEIFEQEIVRSKLSLSDVLDQASLAEAALPQKEARPVKVNYLELKLPVSSAIAIDIQSQEVLFSQEADKIVPIASLTKLMAALAFLDLGLDWDKEYQIKASDYRGGGQQYVAVGDILSLKDLLSLSLVASANTAAQALVSASGKTEAEFIALMNEKAKELKLVHTSFRDPVGFSQYNLSTAIEIAAIVQAAIERPEIREVIALNEYECETKAGHKRYGHTTNKLFNWDLPKDIGIIGGKTGYTVLAGNCFAGGFHINNEHGIITVVMGAATENGRFRESLALAEWVRDSYRWP